MRNRLRNSKALTVLEVMLSCIIFSMLAGIVFYIFVVSAKSWLKVRKQVEVSESAQVIISRIEREIRGSSFSSVELADYSAPNNAISFLSAYDAFTGRTAYDKAGLMAWKKYIIFYVEDDKRVTPTGYYQLFSREVSLGEFADPNGKGYGTKCISEMPYFPLESEVEKTDNRHTTIHYIGLTSDIYTSSPRPIARNITLLNFELDFINRRVVINLQTGKPINPNDINSEASPEKSKFRAVVTLRNN